MLLYIYTLYVYSHSRFTKFWMQPFNRKARHAVSFSLQNAQHYFLLFELACQIPVMTFP